MFGKKKTKDETNQSQSLNIEKEDVSNYHDAFSDFEDFDDEEAENSIAENSIAENSIAENSIAENSSSKNSSTSKEVKNAKSQGDDQKIQQDKTEYVLYVVVDKYIPGMINIFREAGLKVSSIYDNITDVKNEMLMQSEPTRLVLVDTGTGKFTTTSTRAEIIDMLGISDEQNKTTVFFTDSALKIDTIKSLGKVGKSIDWLQYQSTSIVIATILNYKEQYKYDVESENDVLEREDDILKFKGIKANVTETERLDISGFDSDDIIKNMLDDSSNSLVGYHVKIRNI